MICMMGLVPCVVVGLADNYTDLISTDYHTSYFILDTGYIHSH